MTRKTHGVDFKKLLNPAQWEAVATIDGPLLVVAGAGTGKTRVIEYRCLYMLEQGIKPEDILLLTFTRKASREMLGRASLHDAACRRIEGGTFHSFAYRVIKKYKSALGFGDNISFVDEEDAATALHLLAARLGVLEEKERFPKKDTLRNILSMSLNRGVGLDDVLSRDYPHFLHLSDTLEELRKKYAEYKIERNLIDYDDMMVYLKFLLDDPVIHEKVSSHTRYCMVDEFQDTNKIQADIVFALNRNHRNCMAVGDDTQSIYSFRGAYYKNMFDFPKSFPETRIVKLEYNYRSIQPILDVANALIEGEKEKYSKVLITTCEGDESPTLSCYKDSHAEAEGVASKIKAYRDAGTPLASIGVLYRSHYLALPLQLELSKLNIPFVVYGGLKFIETAHIKDVLAFLKAHHNSRDELSLARVLLLLDGIGPKSAEKVKAMIFDGERAGDEGALASCIKNSEVRAGVLKLIALFRTLAETSAIGEKLKKIIHFYTPYLKRKFDDYPVRQEDLKIFTDVAASYASLEELLIDFVALEPPERSVVGIEGRREDEPPVVLSTIHSAKGLEWEAVFIIAAMDGSIPVSYALDDAASTEEERRLLYVAVTRARKHLHISMHNQGRNGGLSGFNRISRFLSDPRVMEKLTEDHTWYEEEGQDREGSCVKGTKQGLYRRLMDHFGSHDIQDHF